MCRVLGVSTSGYYAWRKRGLSKRAQEDAVLIQKIKAAFDRSDETYGVPRIHPELRDEGIRTSRKRIARLMRAAGLRGVSRRPRVVTTRRDRSATVASDLVRRQFRASQPNELWLGDITYVSTGTGYVYLAVVLDVFNREIVGWSLQSTLRTGLVVDALDMALRKRRPSGVIHHSDQGIQYTSAAFAEGCKAASVRLSMGRIGNCFDNAMCESFFATLQCELLDRRRFETHHDARIAIFRYIEGWYNLHRRHSALGYKSPAAYLEMHQSIM